MPDLRTFAMQRRLRGMSFLGAAYTTAQIAAFIQQAAAQYGVDPSLAMAVAQQESRLNPNAVSSAGAQGVMQLEPPTAAQYGVTNPFDPQQNVNAGVHYLADLIAQFGGDVVKGVAAYNWGPGNLTNAISSYGANWLAAAPAETQNYVATITGVTAQSNAAAQQPVTLDASTGQPVDDSTDTSGLVTVNAGIVSGNTDPLVYGGMALGAILLVQMLRR